MRGVKMHKCDREREKLEAEAEAKRRYEGL
jgi:hypothetical protein